MRTTLEAAFAIPVERFNDDDWYTFDAATLRLISQRGSKQTRPEPAEGQRVLCGMQAKHLGLWRRPESLQRAIDAMARVEQEIDRTNDRRPELLHANANLHIARLALEEQRPPRAESVAVQSGGLPAWIHA